MTQDELRAAMLKAFTGKDDPSEAPKKKPKREQAIQARVLSDMLPHVTRKNPFEPGDLVVQASNRRTYRYPEEGHLALVVDTFPPQKAKGDNGAYSREDMVILVSVEHDERTHWVEFSVESWRFEKYTGPVDSD